MYLLQEENAEVEITVSAKKYSFEELSELINMATGRGRVTVRHASALPFQEVVKIAERAKFITLNFSEN